MLLAFRRQRQSTGFFRQCFCQFTGKAASIIINQVYNLAVLRLSDSRNRAEQCQASCPGCLVEPRNDFNFFLSLVVLPFFVCVSLTTQYAQFSLPVPEGPISTSWARPLTFPVW